ncbi:acyltransferase [Burkholderia vietnamiensis]|uniref:acyltransferase n=1 Tax=Burkholderia vietnamiensis TaxID=60552 RepID=UPI0009BCD3D1|nr:acyltransferase family protein [Burkholderia vietnamiensis]
MDRRVDALRVVACFLVVLLHVSSESFVRYSPAWNASNCYESLSRACVPIFFMISGANLLRKNEPLGTFLSKRVLRVIPPLVFWSLFYLWWLDFNNVHTGNWILAIIAGPTMFHLWFFYVIFGIYLVVPAMRRFYQNASQSDRLWLLAVWLLTASLFPNLQALFTGREDDLIARWGTGSIYDASYYGMYAGFLVLGAYLADLKGNVVTGLSVFATSFVATALGTVWESRIHGVPNPFFQLYLSPLVVIAACGLFYAFMGMTAGKASSLLNNVSGCTLGIYGLHPFLIDPFAKRFGLLQLTGWSWIDPFFATLLIFSTALAIVAFLRWIPLFGNRPLRIVI